MSHHTEERGVKYSNRTTGFVECQILLIVLLITTHTITLCERIIKIVIPVDSVIPLQWIGKVKNGVEEDQ